MLQDTRNGIVKVSACKEPEAAEIIDGVWTADENAIYAGMFISKDDMQTKRKLLQRMMNLNPWMHYSWETVDDYLWAINGLHDGYAAEIEEEIFETISLRNSGWTFEENIKGLNPYWKMTKTEFEEFSKIMNEMYC